MGQASVWGLARCWPLKYGRKVDAATRCSGACFHSCLDLFTIFSSPGTIVTQKQSFSMVNHLLLNILCNNPGPSNTRSCAVEISSHCLYLQHAHVLLHNVTITITLLFRGRCSLNMFYLYFNAFQFKRIWFYSSRKIHCYSEECSIVMAQ